MRLVKEQLDLLQAQKFFRNPKEISGWILLIEGEMAAVKSLYRIMDDAQVKIAIARLAAVCILALLRSSKNGGLK